MPIYEYECRTCHHRFEVLVRNSNASVCPCCNAENPERLLSSFGVSSQGTRQTSLGKARKAQAKVQRDKTIAEHELLHKHHH